MTTESLKQAAKSFIRPFLRPLLFRLNRPLALLEPRITRLEHEVNGGGVARAQIDQLQQEGSRHQRTIDDLARVWLRVRNDITKLEAGLSTQSPELNVIVRKEIEAGTANLRHDADQRAQQVDGTLRFLLDRVEFVRRELMYEMSYGAGSSARPGAARSDIVSKVVDTAKVSDARAGNRLKLNLGCGHIPMDGYINVDAREIPGVDVVADVGLLPFEPGTVDEVFSSHLVEHFPQEELRRRLLPHWRAMLKPGGTLKAIVPDGDAMLRGVAAGSYAFEDFREVLFGSQDYNGDFHFNLLTPDSLTELLVEAGFTNVEILVRGRRNGQCFEFEISALR